MQGILIDPKAKTVTTCEVDGKNPLQSLHALIQCFIVERSIVEQVSFGNKEALFVDEEGKLAYPNKDGYFTFDLCPGNIFAGRGILLSETPRTWKSTGFSIEEVQRLVQWCNPTEKQVKPRAFLFSW